MVLNRDGRRAGFSPCFATQPGNPGFEFFSPGSGFHLQGGTVIRYSEGPSIRYNGPKFPDFLRKGSRYKVQWVKIANFFGKRIFPIFYEKGPAIRYNGRSNREKKF